MRRGGGRPGRKGDGDALMVLSRDAMRRLAVLVAYLLLLRAKVSDDGPYTLGEQVPERKSL